MTTVGIVVIVLLILMLVVLFMMATVGNKQEEKEQQEETATQEACEVKPKEEQTKTTHTKLSDEEKRAKRLAYNKQWRKNNADKVRAYAKAYYAKKHSK